jgi:hypothetical protein
MRWICCLFPAALAMLAACGMGSISAVASGAEEAEKVSLQLRLKPADIYKMRMTVDPKYANQMPRDTTDIKITFEVREVDRDGNATIKTTVNSLQYRENKAVTAPQQRIAGVSGEKPAAKPGRDETAKLSTTGRQIIDLPDLSVKPDASSENGRTMPDILLKVFKSSFNIRLTPTGWVDRIEDLDARFDDLLKNEKQGTNDYIELRTMLHNLKLEFGADAMVAKIEQMLAVLPREEVAAGDSWVQNRKAAATVSTIAHDTWTLKSRKDGVAVLEVHSKMVPDPNAGPIIENSWFLGDSTNPQNPGSFRFPADELKTTYKFRGDQEGTVEVDEATGWPIRGKLVQNYSSGDMSIRRPVSFEKQ